MASAKGKIHLVGSLGFQNAEIAFRALAAKLGTRAPRYPDGEPGERGYWIRWQNRTFAEHPAFRQQEAREIEGYVDGKTRPLYVLDEEVDPDLLEVGILGYAEEALASWNIFSELVDEGVIPSSTRFQVCMPSCAALLTSFCAFCLIHMFVYTLDCAAGKPVKDNPTKEVKRLLQIDANKRAQGQVVSSMGMLIGLSWEKAFDKAIETVAEMQWVEEMFQVEKLGFFLISMFMVSRRLWSLIFLLV